ncbi:MAG: pyridoxamine 5'-phosphate oxidase family protein [Methylobacteriaceae bacterium]|nr:pyridoxamine 5'-phosphate oxidase family protein [Methylobacteriaceae bacterium]
MTDEPMTSAKVWDLIERQGECLFADVDGDRARIRPMAPIIRRDEARIWFFTDRDSWKVEDLDDNSPVTLAFRDASAGWHVVLTGAATAVDDRATATALWSEVMKQFFDGPDDPRLILIAFDPREAETWTGPGRLVTGLKLAFTAITGKRTSIGEQRTVPM